METLTNPNQLLGFHVPEGFSRITRGGRSDIYLVVHRVPLGAYTLSVEYAMDDYEDDMREVGHTLFVRKTDGIEHLSGLRE